MKRMHNLVHHRILVTASLWGPQDHDRILAAFPKTVLWYNRVTQETISKTEYEIELDTPKSSDDTFIPTNIYLLIIVITFQQVLYLHIFKTSFSGQPGNM